MKLFIPKKDWDMLQVGAPLQHVRIYRTPEDFPPAFRERPEENPVVLVEIKEVA